MLNAQTYLRLAFNMHVVNYYLSSCNINLIISNIQCNGANAEIITLNSIQKKTLLQNNLNSLSKIHHKN